MLGVTESVKTENVAEEQSLMPSRAGKVQTRPRGNNPKRSFTTETSRLSGTRERWVQWGCLIILTCIILQIIIKPEKIQSRWSTLDARSTSQAEEVHSLTIELVSVKNDFKEKLELMQEKLETMRSELTLSSNRTIGVLNSNSEKAPLACEDHNAFGQWMIDNVYNGHYANLSMYASQSLAYHTNHFESISTFLELGSGVFPVVPQVLAGFGIKHVIASDVDKMCFKASDKFDGRISFPENYDYGPLDEYIARKGKADFMLSKVMSMEDMKSIPSDSVDLSYSCAVLEHISSLDQSFDELTRISTPGSVSCHQVDLRYHTDFTKPLDFLFIPEDAFREQIASHHHPHFGNRFRYDEFVQSFESRGWQVLEIQKQSMSVTSEYWEETISKIKQCDMCKYRDYDSNKLKCVPQSQDGSQVNVWSGIYICAKYIARQPVPYMDDCAEDHYTSSPDEI